MKNTIAKLAIASAFTLSALNAFAGENLWLYAKGTDTRPKGSFEFKIADTIREDKNVGDYTFHDIRPELEYGITDKLTVFVEAVIYDHDYNVGPDGPCPTCDAGDGTGVFNDTQFGGYDVGLKYNVLSPYKDAFGFSYSLAYERRDRYRLDGSDIDQDSFSGTIFLQKNFLDNTLTTVFNIKAEAERRKSDGGNVIEDELSIDASIAISYRFAPKWFVGLELRHQSDYLNPEDRNAAGTEGFDENGFEEGFQRTSFDLFDTRIGTRHQYGNYFGPTIHFAQKKWWVTGGALWQISGGGSVNAFVQNGRNFDEHEKIHYGFSFGYEF